MLWKISVTTSAEAEEAVGQLLEKIFAQPATVYVDAKTQRTAISVYAPRAASWSAAKRATLRAGLKELTAHGLNVGRGEITAKKIRQEQWAESWKKHFKPVEIAPALLLKPSWSRRRAKKNQAMIVLDPGLSFGTGQHPTTRFCLEQIVAGRKVNQAQSFLDIGAGSGILAIAAAKLGYRPVVGIDCDPDAVRIARANARENGVIETIRLIRQDVVRRPLDRGRQYDLICANLIFDLLLSQKQRIVSRLKPGGVLVLAGILRSQFPQVRAAYGKCGLRMTAFKAEKEWASGAFSARSRRRKETPSPKKRAACGQ